MHDPTFDADRPDATDVACACGRELHPDADGVFPPEGRWTVSGWRCEGCAGSATQPAPQAVGEPVGPYVLGLLYSNAVGAAALTRSDAEMRRARRIMGVSLDEARAKAEEADEALDYMRERIEAGRAKYGQYLHTHDGRDAQLDLREEIADAIQYAVRLALVGEQVDPTSVYLARVLLGACTELEREQIHYKIIVDEEEE